MESSLARKEDLAQFPLDLLPLDSLALSMTFLNKFDLARLSRTSKIFRSAAFLAWASIPTLWITGSELDENIASSVLTHCSHLVTLCVTGISSSAQAFALASAFPYLRALQGLSITLNAGIVHDDDEAQPDAIAGWICVASAIPRLSGSLQTLGLTVSGGMHFDEPGIVLVSFASILPVLSKLRCLCFAGFTFSGRTMKYLCSVFPFLSSLDSLGFATIFHDSTAMAPLSVALPQLRNLRSLVFTEISFNIEQMTDLALSFQDLPHVTSLTVRDTYWQEPRVIAPLFTALSHLHALEKLDLSNSQISKAGCPDLASSLPHLTSLRDLNLSCNSIGDEGSVALCSSLASIAPSLTQLNLHDNAIANEGCRALCAVLPSLLCLKALDLSSNLYDIETRAALADALSDIPFLEQCHL